MKRVIIVLKLQCPREILIAATPPTTAPHHRVGPLLLTMDSIALGLTRSRNSYKMIVMHIYATHRSCASVAIIACMACGISVLGATTVARLV